MSVGKEGVDPSVRFEEEGWSSKVGCQREEEGELG